ncbi:MAG: hypothetical protein JNK41_05885 [Saprospiraceae bacterium]|jgi:hypothetical protein|nr:hypothetical protein [Saprospiraceae bacterium]
MKLLGTFFICFIFQFGFSQNGRIFTPLTIEDSQMDTTVIFDVPKIAIKSNYFGALTDEETKKYTNLGFVPVSVGEDLWTWKNNTAVRFRCDGQVIVKKLITENQITHICMSCGEMGSMECWDVKFDAKN